MSKIFFLVSTIVTEVTDNPRIKKKAMVDNVLKQKNNKNIDIYRKKIAQSIVG